MNLKAFFILLVVWHEYSTILLTSIWDCLHLPDSGPQLALPIMFSPRHPFLYMHGSSSHPRAPHSVQICQEASWQLLIIPLSLGHFETKPVNPLLSAPHQSCGFHGFLPCPDLCAEARNIALSWAGHQAVFLPRSLISRVVILRLFSTA